MMVVVLGHAQDPLFEYVTVVGTVVGLVPSGEVGGGVGGNVMGFCCLVSTFVFVFAFAYVFTLAAALAPLLAFDDVAIRVFTFVFVNACDSELESEAAADPALAAEPAPPVLFPFPDDSSRTLLVSVPTLPLNTKHWIK